MPELYKSDTPDERSVKLRVMDENVDLTRFTQYSFGTDMLTPAGGWSFSMGDDELPERQRNALKVGARIALFNDKLPLADGHIDKVRASGSKSSGQTWSVTGRERIALALDATADPQLQFKEGASLADVLRTLFEPFGWVADDHFDIDNEANRNALTGGARGSKYGKGKKTFGVPLKSITLHALKPYNHESVYHFATRISQRFGLWIWCTADGEQLVVAKPDFNQEPSYQIRNTRDGSNNVEQWAVDWDGTNQPSIIIADGFSGGGEFGKSRMKAYCVNPYFGVDEDGFVLPEVQQIINRFPEAAQVIMTTQPFTRRVATISPRPMYLHDDESKRPDQLEAYVRREMSLLMRQGLTCTYTVTGHGQVVDGDYVPFAVDTVADVIDDICGVRERMYILGVQFEKQRGGSGTTTQLHLCRLNSIQF